jgi:hypothetical protein
MKMEGNSKLGLARRDFWDASFHQWLVEDNTEAIYLAPSVDDLFAYRVVI